VSWNFDMPDIILTADLHLTDKEEDLYRWGVFSDIGSWVEENAPCYVILAGDLCDRKDRHSAILVTTLIEYLDDLVGKGATVVITRGNHDTPLNGPPYWASLNGRPGITFLDMPYIDEKGLAYLPYSDNPKEDWARLGFESCPCAIMHQTVTGVLGNNGHVLINDKMPEFPPDTIIYSGDIHVPQIVEMANGAVVQYIGAPHPVNFGDTYACRLLVLDGTSFQVKEIIQLNPPAKHMLDVYSVDELKRAKVCEGDAAKVRYFLSVSDIENWPIHQAEIKQWAVLNKIRLAGAEPVLQGASAVAPGSVPGEVLSSPTDVFNAFVAEENLEGALLEAGAAILQRVLGVSCA
jgi:DNA repair exonuclease SbcCD nuclease subunit